MKASGEADIDSNLSDGLVGFMVITVIYHNDSGNSFFLLKSHKGCPCLHDLCVCRSKVALRSSS